MISSTSGRYSEKFHRFYFKSLNTNVNLMIWTDVREISAIERMMITWFRETETRFSLNYPHSELSQLNALAGERCKVSDPMLEILALTETYRKATNHTYNPLAMAAIDPSLHLSLNLDSRSVLLPEETALQLDSIVQPWIIQQLADLFQYRMKLKQGLLRVGDGYYSWGRPAESRSDPWVIGINNPREATGLIGTVALSEGALATYTTPDTHAGDIQQCTVAGVDAVECAIWAQTIVKLGSDKGLLLIAEHAPYCEAVWVNEHGKLHYYGDKASLGTKWNDLQVDDYHSKGGQ